MLNMAMGRWVDGTNSLKARHTPHEIWVSSGDG